MALDFPASGTALWAISDATGIRPEWLLPSLYFESGFDPGAGAGTGHEGLNQMNVPQLEAWGIDPAAYTRWAASQQLTRVVQPWFVSLVNTFGPLRSATRVEQANYLPATLKTARSLSSELARAPSGFYEDNKVFDRTMKGYITVGDLADAMAKAAQTAQVQSALQKTYALRPGESAEDPVYGQDFGAGLSPNAKAALVGVAIVGVSAAVAWWLHESPSPARRRRPALAQENPAASRPPMQVQSLLFRRDAGWTPARAKKWAKSRGFRTSPVEVTDGYIHLTQIPPEELSVIRSKSFGRGIVAHVGR